MEEKRDNRTDRTDWIIRAILCVIDLAYPNETLTDKARLIKSQLRKRVMDVIHQIEYENNRREE